MNKNKFLRALTLMTFCVSQLPSSKIFALSIFFLAVSVFVRAFSKPQDG